MRQADHHQADRHQADHHQADHHQADRHQADHHQADRQGRPYYTPYARSASGDAGWGNGAYIVGRPARVCWGSWGWRVCWGGGGSLPLVSPPPKVYHCITKVCSMLTFFHLFILS
ncbi:MAG TPA: hypothetical protein VKV40_06380 [Ktedonobacteraceae bacterium]|nr:hypothetical protein [Ktedonobacteraceae bacterium]